MEALGQHITQLKAPPPGGGTRVQEGGKLWALHIHTTSVALKSIKRHKLGICYVHLDGII